MRKDVFVYKSFLMPFVDLLFKSIYSHLQSQALKKVGFNTRLTLYVFSLCLIFYNKICGHRITNVGFILEAPVAVCCLSQ